MMLIKHMIAVNADGHRIISTVCGQNEGNISTYLKVLFLPCTLKYMLLCLCRTVQVTSHSSCSAVPWYQRHICETEILKPTIKPAVTELPLYIGTTYRSADKSLDRPIYRFILFDGENVSFDSSVVIYIYMFIYSTNITAITIIKGIYNNL